MSTTTLTYRTYRDGLPADVTAVLLSNDAGTAGVVRNDTGAGVVPDATPMDRTAEGVYTHTFDDPAPGLTYTWYAEVETPEGTFRDELTEVGGGGASGRYTTYERLENDVGTEQLLQWSDRRRTGRVDYSVIQQAFDRAGSDIDGEFSRSGFAVPLALSAVSDRSIFSGWEIELTKAYLRRRGKDDPKLAEDVENVLGMVRDYSGGLKHFLAEPLRSTQQDRPTAPVGIGFAGGYHVWAGARGLRYIR